MNIYEEIEAMKNSNAFSGVSFDPGKKGGGLCK